MIREGESIRHPGERRRPVLAALPEGMTLDDIRKEMQDLLSHDANVNMTDAVAEGAHFSAELKDF